MKGWILNIVGVIFIGVILEIILPESKITSFIKHVFTLFLLFVIISPISKLSINKNIFLSSNVVTDSNFIYEVNIQKSEAIKDKIIKELENKNIKNSQVIVYSNVFSEEFKVDSVYVDLTNSNVSTNDNLFNEVKKLVLNLVSLNEEEVFVYGR